MIRRIQRYFQSATRAILTKFNTSYNINYAGRGALGFIDVGSVGGLPDPWRANANLVKFLLNFEPNEKSSCGPDFLTYNTAVWESDVTLPFYVYKGFNHTGSSLFKQNIDYVRQNFEYLRSRGNSDLAESWFDRSSLVSTTKLKCRSLDSILAEELPLIPFHFMKVDTQGAELNILKGATGLLSGTCVGLHLELFTIPLYEGIVLLDGVQDFLFEFGFELVKTFPAHGTFDSQNDCLFLKKSGDPEVLGLIKRVYGLTN